jgi:preprotein translocase subunit SecA
MLVPSRQFHQTAVPEPDELHSGLDAIAHGLIGRTKRRKSLVNGWLARAGRITQAAETLRDVTDRSLRDAMLAPREAIRRGQAEDAQIDAALATLVEAAHRVTGLRPFPVQIAATIGLQQGTLVEMATGEGKTLAAALAGVLAAWVGRPCHVITVNDYLAARDEADFRKFFQVCGVRSGIVTAGMKPDQRREGYTADVTYVASKEILADFLRDRLILGKRHQPARRYLYANNRGDRKRQAQRVMRGLHTAIVDEADSVLIDEAVTPLIISRQCENTPLLDASRIAHGIALSLERGVHYKVRSRYKEVELLPAGEDEVAAQCDALEGMWRGEARREELVRQSLTAREFFKRDSQYVVNEEKVVIVDEFTGRLMPMRTWQHGLHQAIEAKEGIPVSHPSETLARLSFQRFFRLFQTLSGMTGTAAEAAGELWSIYDLPVLPIPRNRPCQREDRGDRIFATADEKWNAVVAEITEVHAQGRPILVGTRSVRASELLAERLQALELEHVVLNARNHEQEAQIIASAGEPGRITIATNMAGRGTDVRLGKGVVELGGLHIVATERHESGRIDRQLFGRSGRQGDPGSAQAFVSTEDELIQRFTTLPERGALERVSRGALIRVAQWRAQRLAYRQRASVLKADTWLTESLAFGAAQ